MKSRVDSVLGTLSFKRVKEEKLLEFKKQILSNKSLKEYFKNNPTEKAVLQNDIQKNSFADKILFRNLDTLPFYSVPKEIMATNSDQIALCTAGSGAYIPDWINNSGAPMVADNMQIKNQMTSDFTLKFVDPDEAQHSALI